MFLKDQERARRAQALEAVITEELERLGLGDELGPCDSITCSVDFLDGAYLAVVARGGSLVRVPALELLQKLRGLEYGVSWETFWGLV